MFLNPCDEPFNQIIEMGDPEGLLGHQHEKDIPRNARNEIHIIARFMENLSTKDFWIVEYGRLKPEVVKKLITDAVKAAGVPQLHPHAMRHYCATRLLKMGVDMRKVQIHLGHGSIKSTQRYIHMLSSDVQGETMICIQGFRNMIFSNMRRQ